MFIYNRINNLIEEFQAENNSITIQKIADNIGISKGMLDQIKSGKSKPTVEFMEKIAVYFRKDLNYFFDNEIVNKQPKVEEQKKNGMVKSPVTIYEPETELAKCYKIMFEQQKEIADHEKEMMEKQKELTELVREIEHVKKLNAQGKIADVG